MKEVSHGGTSFIVGRERSPPVNEGFAGVRPTFCLCSPISIASSKLRSSITGVLRGTDSLPELRPHSSFLPSSPVSRRTKKASNIPPEGMLLAFCTDIYLFLLTVLENILDRPQIFGIAQRHHVFDIRAEKSDVLQSFQLFFLQCHHK